jgi:hypothetical protein
VGATGFKEQIFVSYHTCVAKGEPTKYLMHAGLYKSRWHALVEVSIKALLEVLVHVIKNQKYTGRLRNDLSRIGAD